MKSNKKLKKIIMGTAGVAMAVVVFFVSSMQNMEEVTADVRVFDKIKENYANDEEFKILEIVPTDDDSSKEFGYFLNKKPVDSNTTEDDKSPTMVTYGTKHGLPHKAPSGAQWDQASGSMVYPDSPEKKSYKDTLYQMRMYGLIRPSGPDTAGYFPIYALYNSAGVSVFSNYKNAGCTEAYEQSFEKGVYEMGAGDYNIAEGYTIDESGRICKIEKVPVLSDNGVVSENNPTYDPGSNTITELVPVTDINLSVLELPRSATVEYITKAAEPGKGNVKFTRSETVTTKMQYYGYSDQQLYYRLEQNTFFLGSDYFKEYVIGSKTEYKNKKIVYDTENAKDVTKEQIESADLIYISGKSVKFEEENCDISEEIMLEIYNKEVLDRKAVMMDYACYSSDADTNVSKLAVLLWRESQSEMKTAYTSAYTDENDPNLMTNVDFMTGDALKDLKASMMTGGNGNFVTGNVYVYNHHMSDFDDPKSMIDAGDVFANGDFNSAYTAGVMQQGFSAVLSYITTTNKNSTTGSMLPSVTPAVAIQYILISDGNPLTIMKTALNVLEIQPVTSFLFNKERGCEDYGYLDDDDVAKENRKAFVLKYLNNYFDDKVKHVNFTSMTVDEFNGRNDDLIESYDIIYIGSEMGDLYYTDEMTTKALKNGVYGTDTTTASLSSFNDTNMNGMVYYNIGDTVVTLDRPDKEDIEGHLDADTRDSRYNGRDITKDKLKKLKEYLKAEGLILVEGDLMSHDANGVMTINPTSMESKEALYDHGRMDTSSNMYELFKFSQGYRFNYDTGVYENRTTDGEYDPYPNMVSVLDLENGTVQKADIEQYIASERISLNMVSAPQEYSYSYKDGTFIIDPRSITYLKEAADGSRRLEYDFVITSQTSEVNATYVPTLYIDVNNDGKYSTEAEAIKDMQIVVKASGAEAPRDDASNYLLSRNVEYHMSRDLDEAFSGYLQWKINVQSKTDPNVHASAEGSTVVKNKGSEKLIKILQIAKEDGCTLNLQTEAETEGSLFAQYIANVPGYKVIIKTVARDVFEEDFDASFSTNGGGKSVEAYALEYFDSYVIDEGDADNTTDDIIGANMLVLGYGDDYESFTRANAVTAVQTFIESERPVLMAHDFMIYQSEHMQSKYLRNVLGADKYGVTQNITVDNLTGAYKLVNKTKNVGASDLHSGVIYSRADDNDKAAIKRIESTGKAVAYVPSYTDASARSQTCKYTQGISNYTLYGLLNDDYRDKKWLNSDDIVFAPDVNDQYDGENSGSLSYGRGSYVAEKMNSGQITSYPYLLRNEIAVEQTHAQHLALDLDIDNDDDGETDVVVWYALGEKTATKEDGIEDYNAYGNDAAGPYPADSYYVYNKGNITYTGYGDSDERTGFTSDEAQLFVNILFAAFNADQTPPKAGFFETAPGANDTPINGITVPYDENVTGDNPIDSSVLKDADGNYRYHFYNPNSSWKGLKADANTSISTPIYYRLNDTNFVRGKKYMTVEYYLKAEGSNVDNATRTYKLDDNTTRAIKTISIDDTTSVDVVDITDLILTYKVSEGRFTDVVAPYESSDTENAANGLSFMESGVVYGFYLPMTYLKNDTRFTIYVKAKTRTYIQSSQTKQDIVTFIPGEGYSELTVTKADLLELK